MIASATGFTFSDFLDKATPVSMMSTIIVVTFLYLLYRKQLQVKTAMEEIPMGIEDMVADWRLFRIGTAMLIIIVALFCTHEIFHLAPSAVAVINAIILLFLGGPKMPTILERVENLDLLRLPVHRSGRLGEDRYHRLDRNRAVQVYSWKLMGCHIGGSLALKPGVRFHR